MVRGLALAESTPGPLIMVVQFVAFLGAYRDPGTLNPWVAGVLASLLTVWVTFVPCFLFIFLGAPYVERLRGNRHLTAALNGITAAVVGVIASLATYFAVHTLFSATRPVALGPARVDLPVWSSVNPVAVGITVLALVLIFGPELEPAAHARRLRRRRPGRRDHRPADLTTPSGAAAVRAESVTRMTPARPAHSALG